MELLQSWAKPSKCLTQKVTRLLHNAVFWNDETLLTVRKPQKQKSLIFNQPLSWYRVNTSKYRDSSGHHRFPWQRFLSQLLGTCPQQHHELGQVWKSNVLFYYGYLTRSRGQEDNTLLIYNYFFLKKGERKVSIIIITRLVERMAEQRVWPVLYTVYLKSRMRTIWVLLCCGLL